MNRSKRSFLSRAALAAAAMGLCTTAWADEDAAHRRGEWWQWALSIPAPVNPMVDATGQNCMVGQRGSTWYLAGSFFGGAASRSCTVPQGVKLFFPVANSVWFDTPGICGQGASMSVAELRANAANDVNAMTQVSATLNGVPLRSIKRIRSRVFPVALPADNVFNLVCGPGSVPAAVYPRSVEDGYYAEIEHLSVGTHTLQIVASNGTWFNLNVVYTLTVVPRDGH
jgi:hypothetical protein